MRYHYTPSRIVTVKNSNYVKCWQSYGKMRALIYYSLDCKTTTLEKFSILLNLHYHTTQSFESYIFIHPEKNENIYLPQNLYTDVYNSFFVVGGVVLL